MVGKKYPKFTKGDFVSWSSVYSMSCSSDDIGYTEDQLSNSSSFQAQPITLMKKVAACQSVWAELQGGDGWAMRQKLDMKSPPTPPQRNQSSTDTRHNTYYSLYQRRVRKHAFSPDLSRAWPKKSLMWEEWLSSCENSWMNLKYGVLTRFFDWNSRRVNSDLHDWFHASRYVATKIGWHVGQTFFLNNISPESTLVKKCCVT